MHYWLILARGCGSMDWAQKAKSHVINVQNNKKANSLLYFQDLFGICGPPYNLRVNSLKRNLTQITTIISQALIRQSSKTVITLLNNYWTRLSMIPWIIKTEVCVICRSRRLRQIIQTRGFDNSWYHAKTEFNNCVIIHFLNNRQKKTFICWKMALFQN